MTEGSNASTLFRCTLFVLLGVVHVACDDSLSIKEPTGSGPARGAGAAPRLDGGLNAGTLPDGAPKDCFDDPTTHFEIINACTTATKITKNPTLTKLLPDGGLPPLN